MKYLGFIFFLFLTFFIFSGSLTPVSAATTTRLGGMDLGGYCASLNQGGSVLNGSTWSCSSGTAINMTSACQWQYANPNAFAQQDTAGNPYSWTCYVTDASGTPTPTPTTTATPTPTPTPTPTATPTPAPGTRLGGMNLSGYCQSIGQGGAVLNSSTWSCSSGSAINMNSACQWQYNLSTAVAIQETAGNPYSWTCYSSSSTTPTPTPTVTPTPTPTPTVTATPTPTPTPTTQNPGYYIALGDSFAFGYHLAQYQQEDETHTYSAASFNDGYDADYFAYLKPKVANIAEINYSCPGETSQTFISGGCQFHTSSTPLHTDYPTTQSQLQAILAFLKSHPGRQLITIDIGVNDAINLQTTCQLQSDPKQCYLNNTQSVLNTYQANLDNILSQLQSASPQSTIILVKAPNPVYQDGSENLDNGINQIDDQEAATRGLLIADAYSIFTADNICSLTNFCAQPSDFHPNASGYSAMASRIEAVSPY